MVEPVLYTLSVVYVIAYVFALVGMMLFGGKVYRDNPACADLDQPKESYILNMNDFGMSFFTLLSLAFNSYSDD